MKAVINGRLKKCMVFVFFTAVLVFLYQLFQVKRLDLLLLLVLLALVGVICLVKATGKKGAEP